MADDDAAPIEANAAWGSGIYGCDPARILPVLKRAVVRREMLMPNDTCWVTSRDTE
ncbi:MAG TPA: hypothetical protein VKT52_00660 [Ktedonobacterales bacterium]|nr:hypothetical protein [Ktedonobacterales bacterium]